MPVKDLHVARATQEVVVLLSKEMETATNSVKQWTSSIEVLQRRFARLAFKDRLVLASPLRGIDNLLLDD